MSSELLNLELRTAGGECFNVFPCLGVPPRLVLIMLYLLENAPKADLTLFSLVIDPEFHN